MIISSPDFAALRRDFPILQGNNRGKPLIYLDSAASSQKPQVVIDAINHFYESDYANIHRGIYELSQRATDLYEATRNQVKQFIHAADTDEIVFVRGTTEAINLVAQTFYRAAGYEHWKTGDEIILSEMEHHSNIVPWYLLKEQLGLVLKIIPVTDEGELDLITYENLFSPRTKLVAVTHASNVLGTINPVNKMTAIAHQHQVPILIDGAQAVPHIPVNIAEIDCDFYAFSSHKLYGPTGIGVLCAKKKWLEAMPPYQGGGDMIETVAFSRVTFRPAPQKFEAGTPDIVGVIGLAAALRYLDAIGMENVAAHEKALLHEANSVLSTLERLRVIGTVAHKVGVISFVIEGVHPHDIGTVLDHEGIAIRAGHHCAMPLMQRLGVPATARASFGIYNDKSDIDALIAGIQLAMRLFS